VFYECRSNYVYVCSVKLYGKVTVMNAYTKTSYYVMEYTIFSLVKYIIYLNCILLVYKVYLLQLFFGWYGKKVSICEIIYIVVLLIVYL